MKKINSVLKEVLWSIDVPKEDLDSINSSLKDFISDFKSKLKSEEVGAEVFVGGSAAKGTLIKKEDYDIDIFVRFDASNADRHADKNFSTLTEKILKKMKLPRTAVATVHGSRDYFRVRVPDRKNLFFEIIPVKKIKNSKEAENITDLSYSHVSYVKKKLKGKVLDEVKLAKAFCYAKKCYGAESYIRGFSGYGLELLIYHYGSFVKMLRELSRVKRREKLVIDIEKFYRNKNMVLMDLNASKLGSPIVLVDPTYKTRNVLAALSEETFAEFQKAAKNFLKNPKVTDFKRGAADFEKARKSAVKKKLDFVLLEATTEKQAGDVAGSKLLKFYKHLKDEISKTFYVKSSEFEYPSASSGQMAKFSFSALPKKEILIEGPRMPRTEAGSENVKRFKARHRKTFVKRGRVCAREKVGTSLKKFVRDWKKKNKKKVEEMSVNCLRFKD